MTRAEIGPGESDATEQVKGPQAERVSKDVENIRAGAVSPAVRAQGTDGDYVRPGRPAAPGTRPPRPAGEDREAVKQRVSQAKKDGEPVCELCGAVGQGAVPGETAHYEGCPRATGDYDTVSLTEADVRRIAREEILGTKGAMAGGHAFEDGTVTGKPDDDDDDEDRPARRSRR